MLLLCVTGLPLIFKHEIEHAIGSTIEPPSLKEPQASQQANVDAIIAKAKSMQTGHAVQFLIGESDETEVWFVRLGKTAADPEASAFYTFDSRTGEFLSAYPVNEGFINLMFRLHVDLFAGVPGMLFLGFMGLLLTGSLISGAVVYGPYMKRLDFGTVRRERSARIRWMDLHNLIGIVTLVWVLVVGITGVVNTLSIPIFRHWQNTQLADMVKAYKDQPALEKVTSVQQALNAALASEPEMKLSFMAFPGNSFASPHHYVAFMQGTTPLTSKLLMPVLIDAQTNQVIDKRELPWYVSTLLLSQPLHFGDYGQLPLKIIWAALDVLSIILLGSGVYLWVKKRKQDQFVLLKKADIGNINYQPNSKQARYEKAI